MLVSFFGTTFYGYSCEFPKREAREINPVLDPLLIELSYEANPLGLTGPRKMKMYIARDKPRPTKGSLLSNLYEKETK